MAMAPHLNFFRINGGDAGLEMFLGHHLAEQKITGVKELKKSDSPKKRSCVLHC